ncbi:hypothetical protein [Parachitinimonas caeni]|uniref:Uncharacterized protein n=1 Tax=Parachitinimonas caeni TaxID=3031301 RepID=A0ABT7DT36_9NEIS|nr:hypothetical protein [Parachitinimonas caeni]MDK2123244.1 hypothetical protein [Parachitinimonas caeni]
MKRLFVACLTSFASAYALAHGDLQPAHGGVIEEGALVTVELVAKPGGLAVYLSDHGKAMDAKGASGSVIVLGGGGKVEAKLTPADGNALSATGNFKLGSGSKAIVKLSVPGKGDDQIRFSIK